MDIYKVLKPSTNINDILFHLKRISNVTNMNYLIYRRKKNVCKYTVEYVDVPSIQKQYLSYLNPIINWYDFTYSVIDTLIIESRLLNLIEFNAETATDILNNYTNVAFIVSSNSNKLLIERCFENRSLIRILYKNLTINDNNYKPLLKLSIVCELFDITKIIMETSIICDELKTIYNVQILRHLLMYLNGNLPYRYIDITNTISNSIDNLFGYEYINFYDNKYIQDYNGYINNIYHLAICGYSNIIKFLFAPKLPKSGILNHCLHRDFYKELLQNIIKDSGSNIKIDFNSDIMWETINSCRIEHIETVIENYNYLNININKNIGINEPPLLIACYRNLINVAKLLIGHKNVNVNYIDTNYNSPLHIAIINKYYKIIDLLLNHKDIDVNRYIIHNSTYLIDFKKYGCYTCGPLSTNQNIKVITHHTKSALFDAIEIDDKVLIKRLLMRNDIDINVKKINYCTPLISLIKKGYMELVKIILNNKLLDINYICNCACCPSAIITAIEYERFEIVKLMLLYKNVEISNSELIILKEKYLNIEDNVKKSHYIEIFDLIDNYNPLIGI